MPKNTLYLIIFLCVVASLLFGINIGKNLGFKQYLSQNMPTPTPIIRQPSPTQTLTPIPTQTVISGDKISVGANQSVYTDRACGFTLTFASTYLNQQPVNGTSTIITDPDDPSSGIVATCQQEIPKPPLLPERIEDIVIDSVSSKLYHDVSSKDGTPRDEVIVRHPAKNWDIIVAGYGATFDEAMANFKFLR